MVEAGGEVGAGVVGVGMVEGTVDMITKEIMVDMDAKADMDTKADMATREDMATTKVAMGAMVTTKVDMEDMVSAMPLWQNFCLFTILLKFSISLVKCL